MRFTIIACTYPELLPYRAVLVPLPIPRSIQASDTADRNRVGSQPAAAFPGGAGITAGWMWAMPLMVMG
jgi:hypothetical protein